MQDHERKQMKSHARMKLFLKEMKIAVGSQKAGGRTGMDEPGRIFAGKTEIFGKYRKRNWSLGLQPEE